MNTQPINEQANPPQVPCPAGGDVLVFSTDVPSSIEHAKRRDLAEASLSIDKESPYAVMTTSDDRYYYIVHDNSGCGNAAHKELELHLTRMLPSFDSIALWQACDSRETDYLVCIHFPVSSKQPIPESCLGHIETATCQAAIDDMEIQAYDLSKYVPLRKWRERKEHQSPVAYLSILGRIAEAVKSFLDAGHAIIRISPDTISVSDSSIRFMGITAMEMPWNERCVEAYKLIELASIPPECRGYLRQQFTETQSVYVMGALAYFLIAGTLPPTCEMLGYEPAVNPRVYNPAFPIGWDEIILRSLCAAPIARYQTIAHLIGALDSAGREMLERRTPPGPLVYDAAVDTHIGITKRLRCPINQDAVLLRMTEDRQRILAVVADGVSTSTYGSGDIASNILIKNAERIWDKSLKSDPEINPSEYVSQIINDANRDIGRYIRENYADVNPVSSECMGSTALVAIIEHGVLTLASVGDSRAYIIRKNSMACITRDHNLFTIGLVNNVPVEICAAHPHAGSLVQCLGFNTDEDNTDNPLNFDIFKINLIAGDTLLMTTDGILDYVACDLYTSEIKIAETIRKNQKAGITCLDLILQANIGGGGDNCGLAVIRALDPNDILEDYSSPAPVSENDVGSESGGDVSDDSPTVEFSAVPADEIP